jgi:MinD superfamily P-loop ATPase
MRRLAKRRQSGYTMDKKKKGVIPVFDPAHPFGRKARSLAVIDPGSCTGCGICAMFCIMKCIPQRRDGFYEVDPELCIGCRSCKVNCPFDAVTMLPPKQEV